MKTSIPVVLALIAWPLIASAQVPAGGEFRVNDQTLLEQRGPAVGARPDGGFIVAWTGYNGGSRGVWATRLDAAGNRVGSEIPVSAPLTGYPGGATIGVDGRGDFVVAWSSRADVSGFEDIFARRVDRDGVPQGLPFQVNIYTTSWQDSPSVAADDAGNFVVTWDSNLQDGSARGVYARRFDSSGSPLGGEFRVNSYTTSYQWRSSVARAPNGEFVIVWSSRYQDGMTEGVFARRYAADGAPLGAEFLVNQYTSSDETLPDVAMDAGGNFVVTWSDWQDGDYPGIMARRFDAAGAPRGPEFRVNTYTTGDQLLATLGSDGEGNFVVTWMSRGQDGDADGVFGQRFDAAGQRRGGEFRVNTYTTEGQWSASLASETAGNVLVAWHSFRQDGSDLGVFAQRFGGLVPAALAVDTMGNRVLEPGETVDLRPSWRNVNGAAQAFSGGLGDLTGPPGATYTITDASGDYGTVADGATAPCADCYGASVSSPATRPATHWDASAVESILPDAQGQQKRWKLHVGRSFTDVPPSNGFYRFVETVLHHGVTGGCFGTNYCPGSPTFRAQMAVFMLVAKEGPTYAPPACGATPMFADVPASNPFCPWIEEVARRGVVAGCGGGNYCPNAAVSREQMAVFVLRALDPSLNPPACGATPVFADVPVTSPFCRWVEELVRRGIVSGCGGGNYCPSVPVTREQVAVFIAVAFGLTLYGP